MYADVRLPDWSNNFLIPQNALIYHIRLISIKRLPLIFFSFLVMPYGRTAAQMFWSTHSVSTLFSYAFWGGEAWSNGCWKITNCFEFGLTVDRSSFWHGITAVMSFFFLS